MYGFIQIVGILVSVLGILVLMGVPSSPYAAAPGAIFFVGGLILGGLVEVCRLLEAILEGQRNAGGHPSAQQPAKTNVVPDFDPEQHVRQKRILSESGQPRQAEKKL